METVMRRQRDVDEDLPPLPGQERRNQQVKIRLTASEIDKLVVLRPDLTPSGIVALVIADVLDGRYRPGWAINATGE
jgi:hypothetical protein